MRKLGSACLVTAGAALAAATLYDASVLTWALGLSIEGSEATVALASLSLSVIVLLLGVLGFGRRHQDDARCGVQADRLFKTMPPRGPA